MNKIIVPPTAVKPIRTIDNFYKNAKSMRAYYESRFKDPLLTRADRFVWDYWLVPHQYKLLRTPAESFFPQKMFQGFLERLLNWGRENLGCQMISHPWLSTYLDGCYQSLHSDVPHGPWSFVYSLTPWATRQFQGGETIVAKPKLLNYFGNYTYSESDEKKHLFHEIEPRFNRLTLFDPRYPHGVNRVSGEDDLLKSRLVIHGWFTEPRPTIEGALSMKKVLPLMDHLVEVLIQMIGEAEYYGLFSVKLTIGRSGKIEGVEVLCGHLTNANAEHLSTREIKNLILIILEHLPPFPKSNGNTFITIPIEFRK